jgi:hypothetical protein
MKRSLLFYGAIAIAAFFIILGIYYFIPGIYHPFVFLNHPFTYVNHPLVNYNAHKKYSAIFFGLAVLFLLGAYFARPKKAIAR